MYFCSTKVKYNKEKNPKPTEKGEKDFQQGEHFRSDFNWLLKKQN